jgi:hypothetical protein
MTDTEPTATPDLLPAKREEPTGSLAHTRDVASARARKRANVERRRTRRTSTKAHILPTPRISFPKQIDLLRAFGTLHATHGAPLSNDDVARVVGMAPGTVSLANPFFADVGLIQKVDGRFLPSREVTSFARVYRWDADKAPRELAPLIRETWFAKTLLPLLSYSPLTERDALTELDKEATAGPEYLPQLRTLLDYLEVAGLLRRNGEMIEPDDLDATRARVAEERQPSGLLDLDFAGVPAPELHPFIEGLLRELPAAGDRWTVAKRDKWLEMARLTVDMIFDIEDEGEQKAHASFSSREEVTEQRPSS